MKSCCRKNCIAVGHRFITAVLFLLLYVYAMAQVAWHDAATVKAALESAAERGEVYYSQFGFYEPRSSGQLKGRA